MSTLGSSLMLSRSHISAPDLTLTDGLHPSTIFTINNMWSQLQFSNEAIGCDATSPALKALALPSSLASVCFHIPICYNTRKLLLPSSSHQLSNPKLLPFPQLSLFREIFPNWAGPIAWLAAKFRHLFLFLGGPRVQHRSSVYFLPNNINSQNPID